MPRKFLISGGGTGGHIFPAIAIANTIREQEPDAEILFVGAHGKMEMEKVPAAGYKIIGLWISGIQRKLTPANLAFPAKLISSLAKARSIIRTFKPDVVIGVGGFASGPVLRMATWMNVPTLIQEQNSFAGITNRWVASKVDKACVAYEGMEKFFPKDRIVLTGNPVRKNVVQIEGKRAAALKQYKFEPSKPILLVVGGSLGARSINLAMAAGIQQLVDAGVQVIWQTGKLFSSERERLSKEFEASSVHITEFIFDMDNAYAAADMVVSRAGAIAVSELCILGKPVILVPFPHAAEDHQTKNAMSLVNNDAALHIKDKQVHELLIPAILSLKDDEAKRKQLAENIVKHAFPKAADNIVKEVFALIKS